MTSTPWLHVVLVAPEIAPNTGNIIRLCANVGAGLHLVEPIGFQLDERSLRRGGLDYHELTSVTVHGDFDAVVGALGAIGPSWFAFTSAAVRRYDTVRFTPAGSTPAAFTSDVVGDDSRWSGELVMVFGAEQSGLPAALLDRFEPDQQLLIPMRPDNRSLNLANAVAVVAYEAWRQRGFPGSAADLGRPNTGTTSETP